MHGPLTPLQVAVLIGGDNFITDPDAYKYGQWEHLRPGTKKTHGSLVFRSPFDDKDHGIFMDEVMAIGPQAFAAILASVVITDEMINEADRRITKMGYNFNRKGWEHIRDLGYLPLEVRAVPEGTMLPVGLPMLTIENTDEESAWLPQYIETWAQDLIWKMATIATKVRWLRQEVNAFCTKTGADPDVHGEYMIHNFGDRGAGGGAVMAGMAHAVSFSGSDSGKSNAFIEAIYGAEPLTSIDAAEHSTMCSNSDCDAKDDRGAFEMSLEMLQRAVDRANRGVGIPVMACPIDTFDDERFVKAFVIPGYGRICEIGGKYVCRPDSGVATERPIDVVNWLREGLGDKGQMVRGTEGLFWAGPDNISCIQGDGLKLWDFPVMFQNAIDARQSATNHGFGFGGGMTNGSGRDDFSCSMKATARRGADGWIAMQKDPKTAPGKKSLKGRVTVVSSGPGGSLVPVPLDGLQQVDGMVSIYLDGGLPFVQTFDRVRELGRA